MVLSAALYLRVESVTGWRATLRPSGRGPEARSPPLAGSRTSLTFIVRMSDDDDDEEEEEEGVLWVRRAFSACGDGVSPASKRAGSTAASAGASCA